MREKQDELQAMYVLWNEHNSRRIISNDSDIFRKNKDDLQQKLRMLKSKLIVGGENLHDKALRQAKMLEESEQELEKRAKNEEQLRKELQQKEVECIRVFSL